MYRVEVHPHVYDELEHSRAWYEERAANLGTEFLLEVDRSIETVMFYDEIVEEVRKKRQEHAAKFNYDLRQIV